MRIYGEHWLKFNVAQKLKLAALAGEFDGCINAYNEAYLDSCKAIHQATGAVIIFTRDTGHHTSGWFKNPEYEQCLHLSLSFRDPEHLDTPAPYDRKVAAEWVELFFEEARRYIWIESPKTPEGKQLEVLHYRVFCDLHWQPINPKGEVYSTELTEKGWQSYSELHPEDPRTEPSILHAG